jgi:hypothetical protein
MAPSPPLLLSASPSPSSPRCPPRHRPPIPFAPLSVAAAPPTPRHRCLQEALRGVPRAHPSGAHATPG